MKPLHCILIFLALSASCERVVYFPDHPVVTGNPRIIAHKGGGEFDGGNTMKSCAYGLANADGIEIDLQRSSDNDIWLSHSETITACGSFKETCFASISNNTIIAIDSCLGNEVNFTRLEEVFAYMSVNYPDSYVSLDIKAWQPCDISDLNVIRQMNQMAETVISLTTKYHMEGHVMVESEVGDFLYYIKKHFPAIETYLATLGDFELGVSRALEAGFTGVSFHFKFKERITPEMVELIHRKGLKIQLWTVLQEDMEEAKTTGADFIQTDYFTQ
jgi:glycerophosphoryl diester phosphodiesterase